MDNDLQAESHLDEHENNEDAGTEIDVIDSAYACEYCEAAFKTIDNVLHHKKTHVKREFLCHLCSLGFNQYVQLKSHRISHLNYIAIKKTFPVKRLYVCEIQDCGLEFPSWSLLRRHKRDKHAERDRFCEKCGKTFVNPLLYRRHLKEHHDSDEIYTCEFCHKSFVTRMSLFVHIAKMHREDPCQVTCDICSKQFSTSAVLERHKNSVHQNKIYECKDCNKVFKNSRNHQVHRRMIHDQEKRHFCSYCNKGFFNNCVKRDHEKQYHENRRDFKCTICSYATISAGRLKVHMIRKHDTSSIFTCPICTKTFRKKFSLDRHMVLHKDCTGHPCPYKNCLFVTSSIEYLKEHIVGQHPNGGAMKRKIPTITKMRLNVENTNCFIDDDDGLSDGPDDEVSKELEETEGDTTNKNEPAVIVQQNHYGNEYIINPDDENIYGNVIEEYEVVETQEVSDIAA